jgi:arylsulfatase A-like enzyme
MHKWLLLPACLLLLGAQLANASRGEEPSRPNVIVILADDLGWSDTTLYGQTNYHQTPNLDRLAKRGVTFTNAYSASPLCSPTRSALLTGLSPARTGITTPNCHLPQVVLETTLPASSAPNQKAIQPSPPTRLKPEYRTLAETLRDAGYTTGHFGKWHLGPEPYSPLQQGFDVDLPHHAGPGPAGSYVAPWKFQNFKPNEPNEHIEDRMVSEAILWMKQNKDKPFYLNYWMFSVHAPFDAKTQLIEKYQNRVDPSDAQRCPTYAAMLESMDDAIGRILDALDELELSRNTIIIFTSDNGGNMYNDVAGVAPTSNRPLRGGKATMFEGGTRVPCVVAWPGVTTPNTRNDSLVQSEDFYPTLVHGLKLPKPRDQIFDGVNITAALAGNSLRDRYLFQYFPHSPSVPDWLPPSVSVHHQDWKLIRIFHGGEQGAHRHLLYNLKEDLGEQTNLADRYPDLVRDLDNKIEQFLNETGAVVPIPNPRFDPNQYDLTLEGKSQPKRANTTNPASSARTNEKWIQNENDPVLRGWKVRNCQALVEDGNLKLKMLKPTSFLGFAAGKHHGPSQIKFRMKGAIGEGHVDWLPDGPGSSANVVHYRLNSDQWQEITVDLPAASALGIVRIYFPKEAQNVEVDSIEITSRESKRTSTADF